MGGWCNMTKLNEKKEDGLFNNIELEEAQLQQQKYKRLVEPLREKSINYELTLEDQPSGKRFTMVRNGARFEEIIEVNVAG